MAPDRPAPYPSPELMELRETETLGILGNHQVGVRDVHPTSITVVATSKSSSPAAKSAITGSRSAAFKRP